MTKPTTGIGILSWRAHETLRQALETYRDNGFLEFFDQRVIYFSDITDADRAIAAEFGWDAVGGPNKGIAEGMKNLARSLTTDYVLLLQNDNPIIEPRDFAIDHLTQAIALLQNNTADLVRLRHRWHVGEGFADVNKYLAMFPARTIARDFLPSTHGVTAHDYKDSWIKKLRRLVRPVKARRMSGRSIFIEEKPETVFPDRITRNGDFLLIDSSALDFTDQCLLIRRDFFLDTLMGYADAHPSSRLSNGFQAPEICINSPWWRRQHYTIAQGRGVFTHRRADGSFRADHPAYERPVAA